MLLLIESGMKVSDILALNVHDVSFHSKCIFFRKQSKTNVMNLTPEMINILKRCIDMRIVVGVPSDEPALFTASQGKNKHKRISIQTVDSLVKRYAEAAGIQNAKSWNPNRLRASYIKGISS